MVDKRCSICEIELNRHNGFKLTYLGKKEKWFCLECLEMIITSLKNIYTDIGVIK